MTTLEVGKRLVELCKQGKSLEGADTLYGNEIVSVEAGGAEVRGKQAVLAKEKAWAEATEVHSGMVDGPWPNGDRFVVRYKFDVTDKKSKKRMTLDEAALYTVKDGKITREEFFYQT